MNGSCEGIMHVVEVESVLGHFETSSSLPHTLIHAGFEEVSRAVVKRRHEIAFHSDERWAESVFVWPN